MSRTAAETAQPVCKLLLVSRARAAAARNGMNPHDRNRSLPRAARLAALCLLQALAAGCFTEVRVLEVDAGPGMGSSAGEGSPDPSQPGGAQGGPALTPAERERVCALGGACGSIESMNIDKVDLLFVIDNSESMAEEQAALQRQFPRLIAALTSGDLDADGLQDVPPAKDLHLAVVSTDMGAPGVVGGADGSRCEGLGDDGLLQHEPDPTRAECASAYPTFLTHTAGVNSVEQDATDLACIAALGTDGCGFEQPLEAALKALTPSLDVDVTGQVVEPSRIRFLGSAGLNDRPGHGDQENAGFVRRDPSAGLSLISVVVVTDEDDCSSADTHHFTPADQLPEGDPLAWQPDGLRCFQNSHNLYEIERYVTGLRRLRPGREHLVMFTAIAGVPDDLVEPYDYERYEFSEPAGRDSFYDGILLDPRMQGLVLPGDDTAEPPVAHSLAQSCRQPQLGDAYPPRRLVLTARSFGANGFVQSICQTDLGPAVEAIAQRIGTRLGTPCLQQPLARNADGLTACDVLWQLPPASQAPPGTPTRCEAVYFDFLMPAGRGRGLTDERDGVLCKVAQLAVTGDTAYGEYQPTRHGDELFSGGWYYDDFSEPVFEECQNGEERRIAFTPEAKPPAGVRVYLDCAPDATHD